MTLMFGHLGNGITVWDKDKKEHGDYKKVAHIAENREIVWYTSNFDIKKEVTIYAKTANPIVSTTQNIPVFKTKV